MAREIIICPVLDASTDPSTYPSTETSTDPLVLTLDALVFGCGDEFVFELEFDPLKATELEGS